MANETGLMTAVILFLLGVIINIGLLFGIVPSESIDDLQILAAIMFGLGALVLVAAVFMDRRKK